MATASDLELGDWENDMNKHCGACGKKFLDAKKLYEHLKICKLALMGKAVVDSTIPIKEIKVPVE